MLVKSRLKWGALLVLAAGVMACGSSNGSGGPGGSSTTGKTGCTPGTQQSCACLGGTTGIQDCNPAGTGFTACECGTGGAGTTTSTTATTSTTGTGATGGSGPGCQCNSPSQETPPYCGATACSDAGAGGACAGHINYAGLYAAAPSIWAGLPAAGGLTSIDAGNAQCKALGIGADHVCDLTEVQAAAAANEPNFAAIPSGTTAWMERTTPVYVEGLSGTPCTAAMVGMTDANGDVCVLSAPGAGGRCNDWQYGTHHIGDGEYIVFTATGVPQYHYDNDTVFNPNSPGADNHHTADFGCGADMRSILCCYQSCM
jgi:hypothetical protein